MEQFKANPTQKMLCSGIHLSVLKQIVPDNGLQVEGEVCLCLNESHAPDVTTKDRV